MMAAAGAAGGNALLRWEMTAAAFAEGNECELSLPFRKSETGDGTCLRGDWTVGVNAGGGGGGGAAMDGGGGGLVRPGAETDAPCRTLAAIFMADGKWEVFKMADGSSGAGMAGGGARPDTSVDALAVEAVGTAIFSSTVRLPARTSRGRVGDRPGAAERGFSTCNGASAA